jgi:protein phosphatase
VQLSVTASTHAGARSTNEDYCELFRERGLILLADGAGGICTGVVAARLAAAAITASLPEGPPATEDLVRAFRAADQLIAYTAEHDRLPATALAETIRFRLDEAARGLLEQARRGTMPLRGMFASTMACVIGPSRLTLVHAGSLRAYRLRDRALTRLTREHVLPGFPKVVTNPLGLGKCEPEVVEEERRDGDVHLLCTDGLHHFVGDEEIRTHATDPGTLVERALANGGDDNLGLVLIRQAEPTEWSLRRDPPFGND